MVVVVVVVVILPRLHHRVFLNVPGEYTHLSHQLQQWGQAERWKVKLFGPTSGWFVCASLGRDVLAGRTCLAVMRVVVRVGCW